MPDEHERETFVSFVEARWEPVRRLAYRLCLDATEADDLAQEALARAWARWERIQDGNPEAYVNRIVTSVFLDRRRRETIARRVLAGIGRQSQPQSGESVIERADLRSALLELPPRQRAAVVLRYVEDQSSAQAADVLGCSVGTIKSQAHDGLARLRTLLGSDYPTMEQVRGDS